MQHAHSKSMTRRQSNLGGRLSALPVLALLALGCATSATGRKQLLLVPNDEVRTMGEKAFVDVKSKSPAASEPITNEYVRCVASSVLTANGATASDWEIVVFQDDAVNAFALPGGKIGVFTGLLKVATNQDQLAAVIGHEIAHVTQQHSNERVSQAFVAEGGLAVASAAIGSGGAQHDLAMAALGIGAQYGVLMPFGRTQESEADVVGLEYMARAGFNPAGAVQLWKNMSASSPDSTPEFLSTHPSHETRIHELETRMPSALALYQGAQSGGQVPSCLTHSDSVARAERRRTDRLPPSTEAANAK